MEPKWSQNGAKMEPKWNQNGAKMEPNWSQKGSKMKPKSVKNLIEIRLDFCNDFECLFFRSWLDFGSKNLSNMRGLGVTFSTSLRICEKCDFEQPSYGFAIFFDFRRVDFRPQKVYFSDVFSKMLSRRIFFDFRSKLGPNSMPNGSPNRSQCISRPPPKKHPQLNPGAPPGGSTWNLVELRLKP